jgi:hypothetical protein
MGNEKHGADNTQDLVVLIESGNTRALSNMKEAEGRLEARLNAPAIKCEISDPLQDVFRSQRESLAQIMGNQVFTFKHIVSRIDNIGNGSGHDNNGTTPSPVVLSPDSGKELKIGKWFSEKGYRIQDLISLVLIVALVIIALSREYTHYLRNKQMGEHRAQNESSANGSVVKQ